MQHPQISVGWGGLEGRSPVAVQLVTGGGGGEVGRSLIAVQLVGEGGKGGKVGGHSLVAVQRVKTKAMLSPPLATMTDSLETTQLPSTYFSSCQASSDPLSFYASSVDSCLCVTTILPKPVILTSHVQISVQACMLWCRVSPLPGLTCTAAQGPLRGQTLPVTCLSLLQQVPPTPNALGPKSPWGPPPPWSPPPPSIHSTPLPRAVCTLCQHATLPCQRTLIAGTCNADSANVVGVTLSLCVTGGENTIPIGTQPASQHPSIQEAGVLHGGVLSDRLTTIEPYIS